VANRRLTAPCPAQERSSTSPLPEEPDLTTTPLVTIGLCAHNAADTIAAAVDSALAQTGVATEIVIVDDASSDGTRALLEDCARQHPAIRLFVNATNRGVAAARNAIIREARGTFICFFDDDDRSAPERVARQLARLTGYERDFARGAPVACHTARLQLYDDGTRRIEHTMGEAEDRPAPAGLPAARRVLMGTPLAGGYGSCASCSLLARTETFRALGGFDERFRRAEDTDFFVRMALAGGHFPGIAEPLVTQTMTRASDKGLAREREHLLMLLEKHRGLFDSEAQYRFCRDWAELKHSWLSGRRGAFARQLMALGLRHPWRTAGRLLEARRNLEGNLAFSRFHRAEAAG